MFAQEVEALGETSQYAERQHIHLQHAERFDVIFVPRNDGAILHRRILDGHELIEAAARNEKAAGMLGKVTRKADELTR